MKRKVRIGIPRALLYYRRNIFWKSFFEEIGANVVLSPITNRDIIERGKKYSVDESCLPSKIYLGHISYLVDKCDYILIPRVSNYGRKKRVCMKFYGLLDNVSNMYPEVKILSYNIDYLKGHFDFLEMVKLGLKINKNIVRVIWAYFSSKRKEKRHRISLINEQINVLKSNKLKILIVAHPYVIYDEYLGKDIVNYLKEMEVQILYSDRLSRKEAISYSSDFSKTLYWLYAKENIGSVFYYKEAIDGIIFLSSFPCGIDSLVNELAIRKINNIPSINIILDETNALAGLHTRLESFIDIIKARREIE